MFLAAIVSAVCVFAILALELRGFRTLEIGIMVFCFGDRALLPGGKFSWYIPTGGRSPTIPRFPGWIAEASSVAVSMLGATVMPTSSTCIPVWCSRGWPRKSGI